MIRLTKEQVLHLHEMIIQETGGLSGVRDNGLLESALTMPFVTFDGKSLYPSIKTKAARLAYGIIKNHPFIDGNKRIGILAMMVFLEINGVILKCFDNELVELGLSLASGDMTKKELLTWISNHS